jgi:hypothetical protein
MIRKRRHSSHLFPAALSAAHFPRPAAKSIDLGRSLPLSVHTYQFERESVEPPHLTWHGRRPAPNRSVGQGLRPAKAGRSLRFSDLWPRAVKPMSKEVVAGARQSALERRWQVCPQTVAQPVATAMYVAHVALLPYRLPAEGCLRAVYSCSACSGSWSDVSYDCAKMFRLAVFKGFSRES